jgi:glycosyltransferase involved in cell wall biosynthesis
VQLVTVGRAVAKKGFDVLLDALARLPADLHWRLTHVGGGERLAALKARAEALGLQERIAWAGPRAHRDVLAAYRASDLFVLPCRVADDGDRDGLPNVLMEAQSQGLACLSTQVSAIPELIQDGTTGVLVPPDDPDALAAALAALIRDPARRRALGRAGAARVGADFDAAAGLDRLAGLLAHGRAGARAPAAPSPKRVQAAP